MKNTENCELKASVRMVGYDYEKLLRELFDEDIEVEFSEEIGDTEIWVGDAETGAEICDSEICSKLAGYFGVKEVTDVHVTYGDVIIDYKE